MLDQFDREVLSASGKAKDLMRKLYGVNIGQNNAEKQLAGIRRHVRFKKKMEDPTPSDMEEIQIKGDGTRTTTRMIWLSEEDKKDPNRVTDLMGFDPLKWRLKYCDMKRSHWNSITKNDDGEGDLHTLHAYNCKVSVSPIQDIISTDYVLEVFEGLGAPELSKIKYEPGNCMLELPIMDLHLGKLAWGEETGDDYDLKIAEELYRKTVLDILGKTKRCSLDIEKIVFPVGQDFFQADNSDSATTAGTRVDTDSRVHKFYRKGIELLVWAIEQLRQIAPVEVMYVAGNHDKILSYCAVVTLHARYEECDSVIVDLSPTPRKYVHYGVNLIGFSHGKEGKRIEHLMQQEQPEAWGNSMFREWHLGDLHHEESKEVGGVKIRRISSITGTDAWHAEKGYLSQRMAQAFIWDKDLGRQFVIDSNVVLQN
jgi:hypothetical protein